MQANIYERQDYGGFWRRSFADCIDGIFLTIIFSLVKETPGDQIAILILDAVIFLAYEIGFKVYKGATPGYRILHMKIVAVNGAEVTVKQVLIRILSSIFSGIALGLGFIWIAIDANKQAWHDKAAGTYVIRPNAVPIRAVEIPQTSLIRVKLCVSLILANLVVFGGFLGGVYYFIRGTESYPINILLTDYLRANPWVQREVGTQIKFRYRGAEISVSGTSGEANFTVQVSGDTGYITIDTSLEKREGRWVIVKCVYNKEGDCIDITSPFNASWYELHDKAHSFYQHGKYSEASNWHKKH